MDRTDELLRTSKIYLPDGMNNFEELGPPERTSYSKIVSRVSIYLAENERLVQRMDKLTGRKEFSNDPTEAMAEISEVFQKNMNLIQSDIMQIKRFTDDNHQASTTKHQHQHYAIILQCLNKRISEHLERFKQAFKTHQEHVKARQQRVVKYGQGSDQLKAGAGSSREAIQSYAMFAPRANSSKLSADFERLQALRRRAGAGGGSEESVAAGSSTAGASSSGVQSSGGEFATSSTAAAAGSDSQAKGLKYAPGAGVASKAATAARSVLAPGAGAGKVYHSSPYAAPSGIMGGLMQQEIKKERSSESRLRGAEKVEASIAQMGALFTQMASLVMEQGESLSRIEDDVEFGLENTIEAHESMTKLYEITKGNRGMILKVFALLVFFIFLFLVWT